MYSTTIFSDERFATLSIRVGDELRCVFLEFGWSGHSHDILAQTLVSAATFARSSASDSWPSAMASSINDSLRRIMEAGEQNAPTSALFAGMALTPRVVHVCTAGDIRVHLVVGDDLVHVTRDHVQSLDPLPGKALAHLEPLVATALPTRQLGGTQTRPPESHSWTVDGPYSTIVCSSDLHLRRPAKEYIHEMLPCVPTACSSGRSGLLATIRSLASEG